MTVPSISNSNYSSLFFTKTDDHLQEAVKIFGQDLAEALKIRDGSWEKVMESWNISLIAWKIIKESKNTFCIAPKRITCETQVNHGLIFKTFKTWSNEKQKYNDDIIEGELITPYGSINFKFHNTESTKQFTDLLEKNFHKQSLDPSIYHAVYSFTLDPNKTAAHKPSYYDDTCGCALKEEFGKNEYSRTESLKIYKILTDQTNMMIEGQAISPKSMSHDIC